MALDAANVLLVILLAISGWTLAEVVRLGKDVSAMRQKVRDLPCSTNGVGRERCEDR